MITFIFQCQVLVRWRNISFQAFNPCRRKSYLVSGMGNYSKYSWILTTFNITWHLCCLGSWIKINLEKNQIFKASMLHLTRKSLVIQQQQQKHCEVHNPLSRMSESYIAWGRLSIAPLCFKLCRRAPTAPDPSPSWTARRPAPSAASHSAPNAFCPSMVQRLDFEAFFEEVISTLAE